ncbi:Mov34/MPN/PAD-1 family protein [Symbiobacterium thermophilum]|uniref:Mov34/MPN/PAD-1 family protein n=1 Tax=Symbiobacterium thermophilum TaxID=2734 RepID=UPI003B5AA09D
MTIRALDFIRTEIRSCVGIETGGALVGYVSGTCAVVTHASDPGPAGVRRPAFVTIEGRHTTQFCWQLQEASGGRLFYLGDWHVHPGGSLVCSGADVRAALRQLEVNATPLPVFISVIFDRYGITARAFRIGWKGNATEIPITLGGLPSWREALCIPRFALHDNACHLFSQSHQTSRSSGEIEKKWRS